MGMVIMADGIPFVAIGDWNKTPQNLVGSGWLHSVDAYIIEPDHHTCQASNSDRQTTIDYAVVSNSITPMVDSLYVNQADPFEPHRQIFLKLKMSTMKIQ